MSKKILIVSPFFYPEPISTAKYNTKLAEELLSRNCKVTVLCSHPLYPYWKPQKTSKSLSSINIIRGGSKIPYPKSTILRRAVLELWFTLYLARYLLFNKEKFDIIISIIPPSLNSFFIKKLVGKSAKILTIVHDLQIVYAKHNSGIKGHLMTLIIGFIEKKLLQDSDSIVFLSETMKHKAIKEYKLNLKSSFVSYPFISIKNLESKAVFKKFDDKDFNIVYAGALGEKQNPRLLLDFCCRIVRTNLKVSIKIFSAGPVFEELKTKYSHCNKLEFYDLVEEKDILDLYKSSDLQLIPQIEGSDEGSIPSKLPNLLMAGVPILAVCEEKSEIATIIDNFNYCYTLFKWEYSSFENMIKFIIEKTKNHLCENTSIERMDSVFMKKFKIDDLIDHVLIID